MQANCVRGSLAIPQEESFANASGSIAASSSELTTEGPPIRDSIFDTLMATCEAWNRMKSWNVSAMECYQLEAVQKANVHAQNCGNGCWDTTSLFLRHRIEPVPQQSTPKNHDRWLPIRRAQKLLLT
jgi:hypothetical protein